MIIHILSILASLVIVLHGIFFVISRMNRFTPTSMRLAWVLMTVGAMGELLAPLFRLRTPTLWEAILIVGFAAYILSERRQDLQCERSL